MEDGIFHHDPTMKFDYEDGHEGKGRDGMGMLAGFVTHMCCRVDDCMTSLEPTPTILLWACLHRGP